MPIQKKSATAVKKSSPAPAADDYAADDVFENEEDVDTVSSVATAANPGWEAAERLAGASQGNSSHFKLTDERQLIAFIVGAPIDSFHQHWIDHLKGQKSFRCSGVDTCPLCAAGDKPRASYTFWVLHFEETDEGIEPTAKRFNVGVKALRQLRAIDEDPKRGGPLNQRFFSVWKTGESQSTTYSFVPVKSRDLDEDWDLPEDAALEALQEAAGLDVPTPWIPDAESLRTAARALRNSV